LQIGRDQALKLSDREVVERWRLLFTLPAYLSDWYDGVPQDGVFTILAKQRIKILRKRLYDLGWFMRCLNEPIARRANAEDKCKGRFWEGRYKSQALLDERALLACMTYVDLNPIRAGIAKTPEESDLTSVQARIQKSKISRLVEFDTPPINENILNSDKLPFTLVEYLELVDWSGRIIRDDKRGFIAADTPPILQRLE
ncbi:MAG: transposase, partial [Gammaproteobacteria bacterium]|nr:transposase [Gammaproteobacteria bacterium]